MMNTHFNPLILLVRPLDDALNALTLPHHLKGNDMNATPHDNEYLAAITGMADTYGWRESKSLPALGDYVSGCTAGRRWSGRVEAIDGDRLTLDVGGAWITASVADITH
jgi:hypothetical protein